MRLRHLSIFSRLLVSIAGAGLLVAIISGVAHYLFASRLIQESVRSQMETALQGSLAHFDKTYTLPVSGDLRVLESSSVVNDLLMSFGADVYLNKPAAERLFLSVAKSRPNLYSSIRLISADGQERIIISGGKRKRNYQWVLYPIDNNFEQTLARLFSRLSKAEPSHILFEGPLAHEDKTFSFLAGISKREPEIGGFGGVVVVHVNLTEYLTYLSNFQIFEQSMTWAFEQTGTRILMPPPEQVAFDPGPYLFSREPVPKGAILFASGRGPKWTDEQTSSNMSDLLRIAFSMSPQQFSTQLRGAGLITALVVLAIVLVATVVAFFVARQLASPIKALSKMTASVAEGNLEAQVSEDWGGELGQLGVAFNHMVHTLRDTTFSKAYVDNIIQSMTDTLVVVNRDGTIGEANHALLDLLGYEEHELLGKHELLGAPFHKLLGDVSVEHKIIDALKNSGFISGMETTYLAKDGSEIPVSLSSSVMRDHDGHDTGFVCVAQDITERKRAEKALHRYKGIVSASSDLMAFIGSDYVYQAVNTAYVEAFDKTIEQVVGRHMADFIGKKTFETTVRPHLDQCLSGKAAHYQHWLELPALGRRYLDVRYDPSHDADGSVSGVAVNVRDITEREKTERRRVMEHAVTRLLAEADTLAHVMPRVIQTICETLGLVCGAHWRWHEQDQVLRHAETWSVPTAELTEFLTCQSTNDLESDGEGLIRRSWASGKYTWISDVSQESSFWRASFAKKAGLRGAFAFPIRVGRKTYGIMEFFSHDSHKPDEALLQSADAIGSQIGQFCQRKHAEAEREALHRRLIDASREAGKAEVATGVLHNVGNVLNSVNVSATLVADKVRESKVTNLTKASQLLHAHADDLATFLTEDEKGKQLPSYLVTLAAHLESERQTILSEFESITDNISHIKQIVIRQQSYASDAGVTESTVIADLLDDALSMNVGERHEIDIIREYDAVPVFTVDKHKLLQIIVNLIRNAKQAINEYRADGKRIMLRIKRAGSGRVRIEVTDNGVGISEDNIVRLFEYGFTTKDEGHGFGLHVSANTAKELGGSLACHSEGPGKGATFTLELPLAVTEQAA